MKTLYPSAYPVVSAAEESQARATRRRIIQPTNIMVLEVVRTQVRGIVTFVGFPGLESLERGRGCRGFRLLVVGCRWNDAPRR